ncbi:MAG: hypothetical protein HY817_05415 [Candidatus Abawacabacteria bacterium]|nr:hypothetical protein [Candidatus Abawacabacteria bacterium]
MIERSLIPRWEIRLFEIIPALITWSILLLPFILSFYVPAQVAIFVILFDVYWLLRSVRLNIDLVQSYRRLQKSLQTDWPAELRAQYPDQNQWPYHLIILPYYQESIAIMHSALEALKKQQYPLAKIFFILAIEERGGEKTLHNAQKVLAEFKDTFGEAFLYVHPDGIVGEVKGKGANMMYAAQSFERDFLVPQGIPFSDILVSVMDGDVQLHPHHCASFAFQALKNGKNANTIYQFIPMYHNNIWDVPALMRVVATGSSFWLMMEANRSESLKTFACYGMSFETLKCDDFWDKTSIIEDGVQYWRHLVAFSGKHKVLPVFTPVYQDAVLNEGYIRTYIGQYVQLRRWAWGASDFALIMPEFLRNKKIPLNIKIEETLRLLAGHIPRATAPLLLFVSGWFPLLNESFRNTVLAFNLPIITSNLLTLAMLGLSSALVISIMLLPAPKKRYPWWQHVMQVVQWIFSPFVTIIFGAIPAIDAQTRLALGKRLEWMVTEKKR